MPCLLGSKPQPPRPVQSDRLVAPKPELGLELQCGDIVGMAAQGVDGRELSLQRQMAAAHDRARSYRCLLAAGSALPRRAPALPRPALPPATDRADDAIRPAPLNQMPGTRRFIGKPRLEGRAGHRTVVFTETGHTRTIGEHVIPAKTEHSIRTNRNRRDKPFRWTQPSCQTSVAPQKYVALASSRGQRGHAQHSMRLVLEH